jgi:hypothetical protein
VAVDGVVNDEDFHGWFRCLGFGSWRGHQ